MNSSELYEQDFALWLDTTAAQLKVRDIQGLDWDHLVEEIESLGKLLKRELESRLGVLLQHLLKRNYVQMSENYRGWENTIEEQRRELELLLSQSPSLKKYFAGVFAKTWQYALRRVRCDYPNVQFPQECPFDGNPDLLLNET
jgi:hypothetical protein